MKNCKLRSLNSWWGLMLRKKQSWDSRCSVRGIRSRWGYIFHLVNSRDTCMKGHLSDHHMEERRSGVSGVAIIIYKILTIIIIIIITSCVLRPDHWDHFLSGRWYCGIRLGAYSVVVKQFEVILRSVRSQEVAARFVFSCRSASDILSAKLVEVFWPCAIHCEFKQDWGDDLLWAALVR